MRSAVSTDVTPRPRAARAMRNSSLRITEASWNCEKTADSESTTSRRAPMRSTAPLDPGHQRPRSYPPVSMISSSGSGEASTKAHLPLFLPGGEIPAEAGDVGTDVVGTLLERDEDPVLADSVMPRARNCMAKIVLPLPELPEISVERWAGSPP